MRMRQPLAEKQRRKEATIATKVIEEELESVGKGEERQEDGTIDESTEKQQGTANEKRAEEKTEAPPPARRGQSRAKPNYYGQNVMVAQVLSF